MKYNLQICRFSILKTFTAEFFLTIAALFIAQQVFAQFADDFNDGDITNDPPWSNASSRFIVASQELRLNAPATAGFAYITTPSRAIDMASWEFFVRFDFNPSSSNNVRIYLVSDQPELSESLNGYFILIGSSTHDICLYRQSGNAIIKILDGEDEKTNLPQVNMRLKVTRDETGRWTLFVDADNSGVYFTEGTVADTTHTSTHFFGLLCNYTSTRSDKFYFDDFTVSGNYTPDLAPPELIAARTISAHELQLDFNEPLLEESIQTLANYVVAGGNDHNPVKTVALVRQSVILTFEKEFSVGTPYKITVSGISDPSGNVLMNATKDFQFFSYMPALFKDIIVTEIMADPTPANDLPETEYVELFNRSSNPFNLEGWQFHTEEAMITLPDFILLPGEYAVVTSVADDFDRYGKVIHNDHFPSLGNTEDQLVLKDLHGITVDSVYYAAGWYKNDVKKNGGWSLELIDPENLCGENENWNATEDLTGGTPGRQNSILANRPDLTGPKITAAIPIAAKTILLRFNEKLDKHLPQQPAFSIEPEITINEISFSDPSLRGIVISLDTELETGVSYSITAHAIYDCAGNLIDPDHRKISFGLPEPALHGDIVVNEILFNPRPGAVDFVEVFNRSTRHINLRQWFVGNIDQDKLIHRQIITSGDLLLPPGGYLVLTENKDALLSAYPLSREENILQVDELPVFNDDEGSVGLADAQDLLIDHFLYTNAMHSVFAKDPEGISLERISSERLSSEAQNWKSASAASGFATPGYLNSNATPDPLSAEIISVEPEAFIPLTGQPDFIRIQYRFDQGGYVANVKIQDEQGHVIKRLAQNELLGTEGFWRWDGDREDGTVARLGYYMVWLEVYDANGSLRTFQKRVAVSARF